MWIVFLVLCCGRCVADRFSEEAHRVFGELVGKELVMCEKGSRVNWSVAGEGFHRTFSVWFDREMDEQVGVLIYLPRDVFVDRFEQDARTWVVVPGQAEVDLEARADAVEAVPFTVAFRVLAQQNLTFPLHVRYPALSSDGSFETLVEWNDAPNVWSLNRACKYAANSESRIILSVPCGRRQDAWWVLAVTILSALAGCMILIRSAKN